MAPPRKPEPVATPPASGPDSSPEEPRLAVLERELSAAREALGAVEAKAQRLAGENRGLREELEAQTRRFDRAWAEREKSSHALPETAPVKGRVLVARHTIRTTGPSGERLVLRAGDKVPEGASLDGLPPTALTEVT